MVELETVVLDLNYSFIWAGVGSTSAGNSTVSVVAFLFQKGKCLGLQFGGSKEQSTP